VGIRVGILAARRAVVDRLFERPVDFFGRHQRGRAGAHQPCRRCGYTQCGCTDIVRQIRYQINVVLTQRGVLAFEPAAEALDGGGDGLPASSSLVLAEALQTFAAIGRGNQIFGASCNLPEIVRFAADIGSNLPQSHQPEQGSAGSEQGQWMEARPQQQQYGRHDRRQPDCCTAGRYPQHGDPARQDQPGGDRR
jgi:hypothetical protein